MEVGTEQIDPERASKWYNKYLNIYMFSLTSAGCIKLPVRDKKAGYKYFKI